MFWKKKQVSPAPVVSGATTVAGVTPLEEKTEAAPRSMAKKPEVQKLSPPRLIPALVEKYLVSEYKMDVSLVRLLKIVVRKRSQAERAFDCRIFDQSEAEAQELKINDYNTLDQHPDLILYEGHYEEDTKHVELTEKKKISSDVPLFSQAEIQQQIEALSEPGSSVFFYQAAGSGIGGPLGRGAAVVELNPDYASKKGKKYIIYTANVIGEEPVAKKQKLYDSNKPIEIAKWIKQSHVKRIY